MNWLEMLKGGTEGHSRKGSRGSTDASGLCQISSSNDPTEEHLLSNVDGPHILSEISPPTTTI